MFNQFDSRKLEMVADGLTLWNGSQLRLTQHWFFHCTVVEQPDGGHNGVALEHARRRKAATYPELTRDVGRAIGRVGCRWPRQSLSLLLNC